VTERPNLVLVSWDSVRADHLSTYGYRRETAPTLTDVAEGGLVFDDAQVPAVGTPASFTGMFTGRHASGTMERPDPGHWRAANADRTFLQEHLQDEGYHTGAFHFNALVSGSFGWDRGWDVYEDGSWSEGATDDAADGDCGRDWKGAAHDALQRVDLANFAVDFKRMVEGDPPIPWEALWNGVESFLADAPEPFFLWVLLIDTHHPYYAPEAYHEWPQPGVRETYAWNYLMRRRGDLVGERRAGIVNAYDNTIRYADAFLDRLRTTLDAEGYGDDPLVVHSDHGDEFGEHANYGHRPLMYDTVTRVPLVLENVGERGRVAGPTSLLDLGSTLLDLAGSDVRPGGRSSLLGGERVDRDAVTVQNLMPDDRRMAAAVGEDWKALYHPAGDWGAREFPTESWEAYDRARDPMETENRWGEHPPDLERALLDQLESDVTAAEGDPEAEGLDEMTEERLRELGYIE
jgi:arylsulfatase